MKSIYYHVLTDDLETDGYNREYILEYITFWYQ